MQRPKPTSRIIEDLSGKKRTLIGAMRDGLADANLSGFYPYLDLRETVAFAAALRNLRTTRKPLLDHITNSTEGSFELMQRIYYQEMDVDEHYKRSRFPNVYAWLRAESTESHELLKLHKRLNPYEGKNLRERAESIPEGIIERLRDDLRRMPVVRYIFECEYETEVHARNGDNHGLAVLGSPHTKYPRKGRIISDFALDVARRFSDYPRELLGYAVKREVQRPKPSQLSFAF